LTHYLWEDLSEQIHTFLGGISLADLVSKSEVKRIAENQDRKQQLMNDIQEMSDQEMRVSVSSL
jgi:Rrf2 family iron-sulfur cluster assembly transcriptional regulator